MPRVEKDATCGAVPPCDIRRCDDPTIHGPHHWSDSTGWHECTPTHPHRIDIEAAVEEACDQMLRDPEGRDVEVERDELLSVIYAWHEEVIRDAEDVLPLGVLIQNMSGLIDSTYPQNLDREAWLFRRVMKMAEEVGEVTEALFGALGENPRKGQTHSMHDVRRELLDVALAALAAIPHFDDDDPIDYLDAHARFVHARLHDAVYPSGSQDG